MVWMVDYLLLLKNSLFLVYQIEFVGDLFGWGFGEEADDDVCCDGYQEGGEEDRKSVV